MKPLKDPHYITQDFWEYNTWYRGNRHTGVDYGTYQKEIPIYSIQDGIVEDISRSKTGYGNSVVVYVPGIDVYVRYAHLSSIKVEKGIDVREGQEIGIVGNTGLSTGIHLHIEVYTKDFLGRKKYLDPKEYYSYRDHQMVEDFKGKFILKVEDHGKIFHVREDGTVTEITRNDALDYIAENIAIGMTNKDFSNFK